MPAIAGPRYPLQGYTSVCDSFFRAWFKLEVGQPQIVVQEASYYKIVVEKLVGLKLLRIRAIRQCCLY